MPLAPFSQRIANDLTLFKLDPQWPKHQMPVDSVRIPPQMIPDQDAEFNLLIQENELWQENRPSAFCFDHAHSS
ncbi:unnamed protein product [Bursaphelenchus xylophilus]|uniref:(pine wood nematode) hypothetical protein n=1 Tax=Bursaphelenchus xylophilus TaxID=6326 RepID=A0A1I7RPP3_BURXY|nr:unnamed protein product [Bursaphelenchus xylophilus]CAG9096385.1 unnamed protein product [Bursaphelenchus xylophilus]